jgi:hypothetical protein
MWCVDASGSGMDLRAIAAISDRANENAEGIWD